MSPIAFASRTPSGGSAGPQRPKVRALDVYTRLATPVDTWVPAGLLAVLTAFVCLGCADRSLSLGLRMYWSAELLTILFTWTVFLAAAGIFRRGAAISVDALYASLAPGGQRCLRLVSSGVTLVTALALVWYSVAYLQKIWYQTTPMLGLSEGWRALAVPVSMTLIALSAGLDLIRDARTPISEPLARGQAHGH